MEAYRDQYATLFNGGRDVVAIGISVDPDTTLASWARDLGTPLLFASDPGSVVGKRYGAYNARANLDDRSLFVIAPDGRVAYRAQPFRELVAESYTRLAAVVDRLSPPRVEDGSP
ncbi:MAG TPA: redoxin domain-containing protein [Gemmatimonadaceae bacterium]|nr:redoxin domain-containing protein [Gemmatimonadaceae bacterium]